MKENGIEHKRITPLWPQANAVAECFMNSHKVYSISTCRGQAVDQTLVQILLNYRTTPHATTGYPPATLLFNRSVHTKLPQVSSEVPDTHSQVQEKDKLAKQKMKENTDIKRKASSSNLKVRDTVLVRQ